MNWRQLTFHPPIATLRQFSAGWLVLFAGLGLHRWLARGDSLWGAGLIALGVLAGGAGLFRPLCMRWVFAAWMLAALPVGWLVANISLAVMFYAVLTPVALVFRLRGRDVLGRRREPGRPSYWSPIEETHDIRRYFRQY